MNMLTAECLKLKSLKCPLSAGDTGTWEMFSKGQFGERAFGTYTQGSTTCIVPVFVCRCYRNLFGFGFVTFSVCISVSRRSIIDLKPCSLCKLEMFSGTVTSFFCAGHLTHLA